MTTTRATRPINWPALIETALLAGTAALLITKALRGVLVFYIHPRYGPLVVVCGVVLLLIAGVRMRAIFGEPEPLTGRRFGYLLLLLPVLLGTLAPARPLGASALASASVSIDISPGARLVEDLDEDTTRWNLLEWSMALSVRDEAALAGKPVDVVAFVYHDPQRPLDGFYAVRYVLTCCAADGSGVGLPVLWKESAALKDDAWVRVRGTIGSVALAGRTEPAIVAASVEPVPQPTPPYLYP